MGFFVAAIVWGKTTNKRADGWMNKQNKSPPTSNETIYVWAKTKEPDKPSSNFYRFIFNLLIIYLFA